MGNNTYYTPSGNITECGKSLEDWQKAGHDLGSSVQKYPSDEAYLKEAAQMLGM